jgi:MoaA/NifB/PqqE/SkfB family radical SAM enzyme
MKCLVPETGLTISPLGEIVLCCASDHVHIGHIKDIEDIEEFFHSDVYNDIRQNFRNEKFPVQCKVCVHHAEAGRAARFNAYNRYEFSETGLKFLEVSTSNICNQMCVTCSGKYSSKWAPYEQHAIDVGKRFRNENHKFHTSMYKMNEKDIQKILKIIPGLEHLTIKGGEPFADPNNIRILECVADTNPECKVQISTNFQLVTDKVIELLHRIDDVNIQASIDGTHELYDWIRGGHFDKTVNNIKRYHEYAERNVIVFGTISIYNWMHMPELIEFWRNIKGVPRINLGNIVTFPKYCSPIYLKSKHIEEGFNRLEKYLQEYYINMDAPIDDFWKSPGIDVRGIKNVRSVLPFDGIETREDPKIHKQMMEWIDFCLIARQNNEDIFELAPYLKEYKYANI